MDLITFEWNQHLAQSQMFPNSCSALCAEQTTVGTLLSVTLKTVRFCVLRPIPTPTCMETSPPLLHFLREKLSLGTQYHRVQQVLLVVRVWDTRSSDSTRLSIKHHYFGWYYKHVYTLSLTNTQKQDACVECTPPSNNWA